MTEKEKEEMNQRLESIDYNLQVLNRVLASINQNLHVGFMLLIAAIIIGAIIAAS